MNEGKRISLADDDPGILDAVGLMLEMEGYVVDTTLDGSTVLQSNSSVPDIYILDIWMSGSDGRDICKQLKQSEKTSKVPVILISASNDLQSSAQQAGADDFLAKPFEIDSLLGKIKKQLEN